MTTPVPPSTSGYPSSAIYLHLSAQFNQGAQRVIISSGQACVVYRLSMVSKDGDWIVREDEAALEHVLEVLEGHGARYRLGAPLSTRYLAAGWSSHLEFTQGVLRIRTDFVSRPPRIDATRLAQMWEEARSQDMPVLSIPDLIRIKRTLRDRDYPIIGALALRLRDPELVVRYSIAPQSLLATLRAHPHLGERLRGERPALDAIVREPQRIASILMQERLAWMDADRRRIDAYRKALDPWAQRWSQLQGSLLGMPLRRAHAILLREAQGLLPEVVDLP